VFALRGGGFLFLLLKLSFLDSVPPKHALICPSNLFLQRSKVTEGRVHLDESDMSDCASEMDERNRITVPGWPGDPTYRKPNDSLAHSRDNPASRKTAEGVRQSVHKVARQKGVSSGRTYTSKYRGVHQTFPTRRWEAQFRRNGKPTSLGCFDHEEEAARAYDRMMVWCELHGQDSRGGAKGGSGHKSSFTTLPLNFDYGEYEGDFDGLRHISQDDLVQSLRRQGRLQAATNNAGGAVVPCSSGGIPTSHKRKTNER
jgi:hypothetical protein